ncbi:hypothetical protein [Sphingobacterium kitahiroshimense]|uniref:Uncharacterized protein n=1 Tax=Sphingobacterium kitahiroshimense TaxID=470446 RepID=A0ABV0BR61_9SPHI
MSKKLHSNSQTDTVAQLQRYSKRAQTYFRELLQRYPLPIFAGMVVCILLSGVLAFTVMRVKEPGGTPVFPNVPAIGADTDIRSVMQTYDALREVSEIQQVIQSIIEKDSLNTADSILLTDALKRFDELQHTQPSTQRNKP